jgi:hypothetical protein
MAQAVWCECSRGFALRGQPLTGHLRTAAGLSKQTTGTPSVPVVRGPRPADRAMLSDEFKQPIERFPERKSTPLPIARESADASDGRLDRAAGGRRSPPGSLASESPANAPGPERTSLCRPASRNREPVPRQDFRAGAAHARQQRPPAPVVGTPSAGPPGCTRVRNRGFA